jgi:hypothetical protein
VLGGFDPSDVVMSSSAALGPLGPLLAATYRLFGVPSTTMVVAGTPVPEQQGAPPTHTGVDADAAQRAAGQLSTQTQALQALDEQLGALASKISDQNSATRAKLQSMRNDIEAELSYIQTSADDSVVKAAAVSRYLEQNAAAIAGVITEAAGSIGPAQTDLAQIGAGYGQQPGGGGSAGGYPPPAPPLPGDVGGYGPGYDQGYDEGYDPGYDGGYGGYGGDPTAAALGQLLPQMAGMMPGALGAMSPMSGFGGLGDLGGVIGSAIQSARTQPLEPEPAPAEKLGAAVEKPAEPIAPVVPTTPAPLAAESPVPNGAETGGAKPDDQQPPAAVAGPSAAPPASPPAPNLVKRPDGTSALAVSPAVAAAASAHLGGASLEDAYKSAGITLPPPGTPVKDSLPSLTMAQPGDLAAFRDRYVMLLGDGQVYLDGSEQPVSALAKLTGFQGFCHPPASVTPNIPPATVPVPALAADPATAVQS